MTDTQLEQAVRSEHEGDALWLGGDLAGATQKFVRMRDLLTERSSAMPDDPLAMRDVATANRRISSVRFVVGDYEEAFRFAREAFEICEAQCEADARNSEPERHLNLCCDLIGTVLMNMGRIKDAVGYLERGVELARWLASLQSGDEEQKHHDLAGSLHELAWALQRVGRREDALALQREQVSLARRLVEGNTDRRKWRKFLASSLSSMGSVLRKLGHVDEARDVLDEALTQYEQAFGGVDHGPFDLQHRATVHRRIGVLRALLGDLSAARTHLSSAVELGRAISGAAPDSRYCQWALQSALAELALVLQREGDALGARSTAREAAELEARLSGF